MKSWLGRIKQAWRNWYYSGSDYYGYEEPMWYPPRDKEDDDGDVQEQVWYIDDAGRLYQDYYGKRRYYENE